MKQIELSSYVNSGPCVGAPGNVIDVTDDNREVCAQLVKDRGARAIGSVTPAATVAAAGSEDTDGGLSESDLTEESSVELLAEHGIGKRYVKALQDAGLTTIGKVTEARETLATVPGVSPKAAEEILKAIATAESAE